MLNKMKSALGRKTMVIIFFIALTIECSSQVTQEWTKTYNGPGWGEDKVKSMAVDNNGNVYVTGSSYGTGTDYDYATIKYNSAGDQVWVKRYDYSNGEDKATAIAVDGNGNIYVTGESYSGTTGRNYATIKYNSAGTQLWARRYIGPDQGDYATSIAVDGAGYVYITGGSYRGETGTDFLTIKYNSSGTVQWINRYVGPFRSDKANSIAVDGTGNVYVSGYIAIGPYNYDFATIKYNPAGTEQWVRTYDGPGNGYDEVKALVLDGNGNIYITGKSKTEGGIGDDYATIKYNSAGTQQWIKRYNGSGPGQNTTYEDIPQSIAVDNNGNVYITGYSEHNGTGYDFTTIKYTAYGNAVWIRDYDGGDNFSDFAHKIVLDGSGNVYITGTSMDNNDDDDLNFVTIKYNSLGTLQWIKKYDGTGDALSLTMAVDNSGNVYVSGYSEGFGSLWDFRTIKYSQTQQRIGNEIPATYSLSQNYPNPFNPVTKISFSIPNNSYTKLTVYDISGKQVAELINSELDAGSYNIDFDASQFASGTYFYRITAGNFTEVKKMILVK